MSHSNTSILSASVEAKVAAADPVLDALLAKVTEAYHVAVRDSEVRFVNRMVAVARGEEVPSSPPPKAPVVPRARPNSVGNAVLAFVTKANRPVSWQEFCTYYPAINDGSSNAAFGRFTQIGRFKRNDRGMYWLNPEWGAVEDAPSVRPAAGDPEGAASLAPPIFPGEVGKMPSMGSGLFGGGLPVGLDGSGSPPAEGVAMTNGSGTEHSTQ